MFNSCVTNSIFKRPPPRHAQVPGRAQVAPRRARVPLHHLGAAALQNRGRARLFVEHLSAYERRLNLGKVSAAGQGAQNLQQAMKDAVAVALSERLTSYAAHHFLAKAARLNYLDPGLFDQEVRVPTACSRPGWGLQARKRKRERERECGADRAPQQHIKRDAASIEGRALR